MTFKKPILFGATALAAALAAAYAIPEVSSSYWQSETPRLTSADESIVCSRSTYLDYRKIGTDVGQLMLDFSPLPEAIADKQRIIDALAAAAPSGDTTQIFVSYAPTGEVFRTACASDTCTLEEMEQPMQACLAVHWEGCVHSLVRHDTNNYCLLEVTADHE